MSLNLVQSWIENTRIETLSHDTGYRLDTIRPRIDRGTSAFFSCDQRAERWPITTENSRATPFPSSLFIRPIVERELSARDSASNLWFPRIWGWRWIMHPFDEHPRHLRLHDRIADRFNCISLRNTVHIRNYILGVRSRRFRYASLCTWSYFRINQAFVWWIIREYIHSKREEFYHRTSIDRGSKRLGIHSLGFENIYSCVQNVKNFIILFV